MSGCFCFFLRKVFVFSLFLMPPVVGARFGLKPMAQMNPTSSRPMAVTVFLCLFLRHQPDVSCAGDLRLPCNLLDLGEPLAVADETRPEEGPLSIAPGRLDHDPSEMRVAGFRDAAFSTALATGILPGKNATITHQLPCAPKREDIAQLKRS